MVDNPICRGQAVSVVVDILTKGGLIDSRIANSATKNLSSADVPDWNVISDPDFNSNASSNSPNRETDKLQNFRK